MAFSEAEPRAPVDVESLYQPIVDLATGAVVGYEALSRWTATHKSVAANFLEDREVDDLDWACRTAAVTGALDAGLDREQLLFVNVEPRALGLDVPPPSVDAFRRARHDLHLVLELTERHLLSRPRQLLDFADRVRALGWGLALDDVGVHTASLAALPFLDPDVIKLDISLVQRDPTSDQARTLTGILAHSERTGTALLAEGIETNAHVERARTLGAAFGQGYLFGRPAPLPDAASRPGGPAALGRHPAFADAVPGTVLDTSPSVRVARKPVLEKLSRQLEQQGLNRADPSVLLATFQDADQLGRAAGAVYRDLAEICRFVGVLGVGMPVEPIPGVHGAAVAEDDPLTAEWTIVVIGAHYAGALIARELVDGAGVGEADRRFAFILTHDRDTVIAAGRHLLRRFDGAPA